MKHLVLIGFLVVLCVHLTRSEKEAALKLAKTKIDENDPVGGKLKPLPRPYIIPIYPCCVQGFTHVDLTNNAPCEGINTAPGIEVIQSPTVQTGTSVDCSKTAVLKVTFDKLTSQPSDMCVRRPYCGRRMLRIDMELSSGARSEHMFNIGDSITNNGYAGDAGTQENDAEVHGLFPDVKVWGSDTCNSAELGMFSNVIDTAVNRVTIYVSNRHIRIMNDQGFNEYNCNDCLFALNGQADNEGSINEVAYIGLNRVVQSISRSGIGVCSATLHWVCPYW